MWLSDVSMRHRAFSGRPRWTDNYWVHTRVMRLFGDLGGTGDIRHRAGILYRVEPGIRSGRVLVQSSEPVGDTGVQSIDLGSILGGFRSDQPVGLRVKANAVRTVNRTVNGVTKTRREQLDPHKIEAWFAGAVEGVFQHVEVMGVKLGSERQRSSPIAVATIDATAIVVDTESMIRLVGAGIGKARAFGCGLISVRPIASAPLP